MLRSYKLNNHKYANCEIVETDDYLYLYSYNTLVIKVEKENVNIYIHGLYSTTTRKHISWFIQQIFKGILDYKDIKKAYDKNCYIDLVLRKFVDNNTGEIVGDF